MRYFRYILFILVIVVGISFGAYYGLEVSPVELVDTVPDSLRVDYRADYVLMVAEAYSFEEDPGLAVRRLGLLGAMAPVEMINEALIFALNLGYPAQDLALLQELRDALATWSPALEGGG